MAARAPRRSRAKAGDDTLSGGGGADKLLGGAGSNLIDGGAGNDTITKSVVGVSDTISGGADIDTLIYSGTVGVALNLSVAALQNTGYGNDIVTDIENVTGTAFADVLTGSSVANSLTGNAGADQLRGEAGNDTLSGGADADGLWGGSGDDRLLGGSATTSCAGTTEMTRSTATRMPTASGAGWRRRLEVDREPISRWRGRKRHPCGRHRCGHPVGRRGQRWN